MSGGQLLDPRAYGVVVRCIEYHRCRVKYMEDRIDERIRSLKAKAIALIREGNVSSAETYLREAKFLAGLKRMLHGVYLYLTAVLERLDVARIVLQALSDVKSTTKALGEAVGASHHVFKNFGSLMESLSRAYVGLLESSSLRCGIEGESCQGLSCEAKELLEEICREIGVESVERQPRSERRPVAVAVG